MKNLKFLWALPAMLAIHGAFAQYNTHLKLSEQYPAAGEKITFSYDPAGSVVDGKKDINAAVYYLDNKDYPVADIDLKADGKLLGGEIAIPVSAKAFFIKISGDNQVDNNSDKGYVYLIYKDQQPVEGAYASEAYLISSGMGNYMGKIKTDAEAGIALYQKEFTLYPQSKKEYELNYFRLVANKPEYKNEISQRIVELEKSNDEKDMWAALNLLHLTRQNKQSDSLATLIKTKFPNGTLVKDDLITTIYMEKDPQKKDSLFKTYSAKYPENPSDKSTSLNDLRTIIAVGYLKKNNMDAYRKYESQIKDRSMLASYLNDITWNWAITGVHLVDAEKLSKQSVDILNEKIGNAAASRFTSLKQAKKNAQASYNASADTYAYILWKENKSAEALPYMKKVYDLTSDELNSTEHYSEILAGTGQYDKAMQVIADGMKDGQTSDVLKDELKKDYIKVKGSDAGYGDYLAPLEKAARAKILADLAKTMIDQPAPAFALKDLDGKTVSLADLKGKVVVVDFWATWCGPCKASFPGMQLAVNKFKDDPNVKFLFIDTWENGKDYEPGVKKFIEDNKYTFHVLLDDKNEEGRQAKIVTAYGVDGIPTKFIIDKDGNIRFKYVGYSGSSDKVLEEVSNMIELTSNPEMANTVTPPVTKGK